MAEHERPAPAFYALPGGGWRDWWTLLHPPYTAWHLSYVLIGAATAPAVRADRLAGTLLAFFLAVGLGAHALDELNGRPLRTRISGATLRSVAAFAVGAAVGLGLVGITRVGPWLVPFIAFGAFIVWAYNVEAFGGRFHSDAWFALAWGAFPALTAHFAQAGTVRPAGVLVAAACFALSAAQRALSTPVRALRRRTVHVEGTVARTDGSTEPIDRAALTGPPERALRALSVALPLLGAGALVARML